jgi:hypothetical protein
VIVWLVLLSFGALVWLSYVLGARLFNPWVGVVTALVVVTRPALLRDALLGYQDLWFMCLVIGAVILEAGRRRRGLPVLVLLAVAGLIRPEAWVLAGLYWLWLLPETAPRRRIAYAAIVAAAPLVWCLMDLIVTGDPLHSLHGTADLAIENERRRGVDQVPRWTAQYFGYTLREPLAIGIPIGLAFAWRHRCRQALLPLAVVVAMTAVFAIGPIFGLPLIGRYLRTPSVLLAVFYGVAVFGWLMLRPGTRERRVWAGLAVVSVIASIAWLPWHVDMLEDRHQRATREGILYDGLREAGGDPRVRSAFERCAPLTAADHRPIPYIRWWIDGGPFSIGTVEGGKNPLGRMLLVPRETFIPTWFFRENLPRVEPPPSFERIHQNRSWRVYAAPGCTAAAAD